MGFLAGYTKRVGFTIDSTKVDSDLSDFPVTTFFTAAQAEEVFAELDADEDFDRGQFALGDGTLLKAEKELFDHSESKGIYHVKIPSVSSSVGTKYYFYYKNTADHNTSYIGIIGSAVAAEVWDDGGNNYFKAVYHMVDATTSTVVDSTSNSHDGTKTSANNPIEAIGIVGQAQDFSSDEIVVSDHADLDLTGNFLIEVCINIDNLDSIRVIVSKFWDGSTRAWHLHAAFEGYLSFSMRQSGDGADTEVTSAADSITTGTNYHVAILNDGTNYQMYINGVASGSSVTKKTMNTNNAAVNIGDWSHTSVHGYMDGIIDEPRVSSFAGSARSAAWIKATYNSLWDSLLTYGSEELKAANTIIMGCNF